MILHENMDYHEDWNSVAYYLRIVLAWSGRQLRAIRKNFPFSGISSVKRRVLPILKIDVLILVLVFEFD
jgi:hypothetical protein